MDILMSLVQGAGLGAAAAAGAAALVGAAVAPAGAALVAAGAAGAVVGAAAGALVGAAGAVVGVAWPPPHAETTTASDSASTNGSARMGSLTVPPPLRLERLWMRRAGDT